MRLPSGRAVAIPMLMCFFLMIVLPSTEMFIIGKSTKALATASIKIGVKVIFSPSRASKAFFTLLRHCQTRVTSTSVKLCTCAEVCLLIVMCSAMSLPIRLISMRSSPSTKEEVGVAKIDDF